MGYRKGYRKGYTPASMGYSDRYTKPYLLDRFWAEQEFTCKSKKNL